MPASFVIVLAVQSNMHLSGNDGSADHTNPALQLHWVTSVELVVPRLFATPEQSLPQAAGDKEDCHV